MAKKRTMGKIVRGERIQVIPGVFCPNDGEERFLTKPGQYYGPVKDPKWYEGRACVWFLLPIEGDHGKHPRLVCSPPHKFGEEPDGTLTIRESILAHGYEGEPDIWHGYLTKGSWHEDIRDGDKV